MALSGGVDSAVAAAYALEGATEVTGVTLDFGIDGHSLEAAAEVAASLGIPHRVIDVRAAFEDHVIGPFVRAYAEGSTPNPCIVCNEHIKLGLLLATARAEGADRLVTGHYARIVRTPGGLAIARATDAFKDQSYFLYRVDANSLEYIDFPLGTFSKGEVRARAARLGLPAAERADSQDVCFLAGTTAGAFVSARMPEACVPGPIVDAEGRRIGTHQGVCHYTVGQRKGLPGGRGPLFVSEVDPVHDTVRAGSRAECETTQVVALDAVWGGADEGGAQVCVRARSAAVPARVVRSGPRLDITLDEAVCAAPGQAAVCYDGDVVVGGGMIVKERIG
ncbi:MAG: tRNA 2-thiouridine(34) synthase MnmA [Coriobacteriia bacterium]|nr:tRNA 2-thiouridine(34) synthase MnmA [Coriobacteriia bacterium]MBN2848529.1 tRNA 2-thiouridine(34) synthase MnmA [Coriobacteriia bacterium]